MCLLSFVWRHIFHFYHVVLTTHMLNQYHGENYLLHLQILFPMLSAIITLSLSISLIWNHVFFINVLIMYGIGCIGQLCVDSYVYSFC